MLRDNMAIIVLTISVGDDDAEDDDDDIVFFMDDNTDAENALDMKIYENQDPFSCDRLALHLPKCKGCSGCYIGKKLKSNSRERK